MATFLVAHGAWTAGWSWKKMHPRLRDAGHRLLTPTLTGLGERDHLAHPGIDLETHIEDLLHVLEFEDLTGVVLIGHSYGGMVATGVADRARSRIARLIYLDAFVPENGRSLFDLQSLEAQAAFRARAADGWRVSPNPMPEDTPADDLAWSNPRRRPQPIKTFEQKLTLRNGALSLPRHYMWCMRTGPHNFRRFYDRVQGKPGWTSEGIACSHNPHITMPDELLGLLERIAG